MNKDKLNIKVKCKKMTTNVIFYSRYSNYCIKCISFRDKAIEACSRGMTDHESGESEGSDEK